MPTSSLRVLPEETGCLLIEFLARRRASSRRQAKNLLDQRSVFINGRRVWMARHCLRSGDLVEITASSVSNAAPNAASVLFQDKDYLIVNKPAGILANGSHSCEAQLQKTLVLPGLRAVHRLDRGTSGCLLFAQHAAARQAALPLFSNRQIEKIYHAIVNGEVRPRRLLIDKPIAGQTATTRIAVLDANRQASHLRINISTGRMHQIRKHLTAIGHPLLGESYYAPRREVRAAEQRLRRPLLHALQLKFRQPITGILVQCAAPLPKDFLQALAWFHLK